MLGGMIRAALVFALSVLALAGSAGAAAADEFHVYGDLLCHRRAALAVVRFTSGYNDERPVYPRLPPAVDGGLSADPGSGRTDCRLPDGKAVRLRTGREQAFPYGAGRGDPPSFFSLWIDKRKVLSRRVWREGYGRAIEQPPMLVGLAIRPGRLTFCYVTEPSTTVSCRDEKLTLGAAAIDKVEYGGQRPRAGTILLGPRALSPAFCRRYLSTVGTSFGGLLLGQDDHTAFEPAIGWNGSRFAAGAHQKVAQVAPAPGAPPLRVIAFSGTSHFFDGDVYVITPLTVPRADVEAFWNADDDPESIPSRPHPAGWGVISGGVPGVYPQVPARYVHLRPLRIDGRLYFLAYPANRKQRPTAVLLKVTPQAAAAPVCEFQRVEPNF